MHNIYFWGLWRVCSSLSSLSVLTLPPRAGHNVGVSSLAHPIAASSPLLDTSPSLTFRLWASRDLRVSFQYLSPPATSPKGPWVLLFVTATSPEGCPRLPPALLLTQALNPLGTFWIQSVHYLASRLCSDSFVPELSPQTRERTFCLGPSHPPSAPKALPHPLPPRDPL